MLYTGRMGQVRDKLGRCGWHALVLLATVPICLGAILLQLIGPVEPPVTAAELAAYRPGGGPRYLPGLLTLAAVLTVHVSICIGGILLALDGMHDRRDRDLLRFGFAAATLIVILILALHGSRPNVYALSYHFYAEAFRTGAAAGLLRPFALELMMLLPTVLGIFGVAALAAAGAARLRAIPSPPILPEQQHELLLRRSQQQLKRFLYVLSAGLVASTVAVSLFFKLPANLPLCRSPDPAAAKQSLAAAKDICARLAGFADEMTTFWGALLSLALFLCGGLPLLLLQAKVRRYLETSLDHVPVSEAETRLAASGLLSGGGEQIKVALTVLAPLASGPVAGTLDGLGKAAF